MLFILWPDRFLNITKAIGRSIHIDNSKSLNSLITSAHVERKYLSSFFSMHTDETLPDMVDIVSVAKSDNFTFLNGWKAILEPFHLILVQDGDFKDDLEIPPWVDYELYTRKDIDKSLGKLSWIIPKGEASISFGFLVSDRMIVYCLDENTLPARSPSGEIVDVIAEHVRNLMQKSTIISLDTNNGTSSKRQVDTVISKGFVANFKDNQSVSEITLRTSAQSIPFGIFTNISTTNLVLLI